MTGSPCLMAFTTVLVLRPISLPVPVCLVSWMQMFILMFGPATRMKSLCLILAIHPLWLWHHSLKWCHPKNDIQRKKDIASLVTVTSTSSALVTQWQRWPWQWGCKTKRLPNCQIHCSNNWVINWELGCCKETLKIQVVVEAGTTNVPPKAPEGTGIDLEQY